jgi:hypothetical protein
VGASAAAQSQADDAQAETDTADTQQADSQAATETAGASSFTISRVDRGTKPDIAIDASGQALIAYMLERMGSQGWVKVINADGSNSEQIHTGYVYGPLDIATSADGRVVVGYHDHDNEDGSIATREGDAWSVSTIAHEGHDGWDSSIAFGQSGEIYYLGIDPSQFGSDSGVELATLRDGEFSVRGLGSGPQPYEWGVDIAVGPAGELAAVFFDADNKDLIFAVEDGDGFALTPIYSEGDAGRFAVLELDADGLAHVAFFQSSAAVSDTGPAPGDIVYGAQAADGSWSFEVVGQVNAQVLGFEDARRTVALQLVDGNPVVAFIDTERLSFAERGSGGWSTTIVAEADGDPLQVVGLAVDGAGEPHITYSTVTANGPLDGEIWYARRG